MDDIGVERACSLCGEQVRLSLTGPDRRDTYTDVLAELLDLDAGEQVERGDRQEL